MLRKVEGAQVHLSGIAGLIDATRRAAAVVGVDSGPCIWPPHFASRELRSSGPPIRRRTVPTEGHFKVLRDAAAVTSYKRQPWD